MVYRDIQSSAVSQIDKGHKVEFILFFLREKSPPQVFPGKPPYVNRRQENSRKAELKLALETT